jgi:hypothetical protein
MKRVFIAIGLIFMGLVFIAIPEPLLDPFGIALIGGGVAYFTGLLK